MKAFPNTPDDLIAELDRTFGEVSVKPDDTMADIMHRGGQRSVILFLKQWRAHPSLGKPGVEQRGQGRPTR